MKRGIHHFLVFYLVLSLGLATPLFPTPCNKAKADLDNSLNRFSNILKTYDERINKRSYLDQRKLNSDLMQESYSRDEKKFLKKNKKIEAQHLISSIRVMEFVHDAKKGTFFDTTDRFEKFLKRINELKSNKFFEGYNGKVFMESLKTIGGCLENKKISDKQNIQDCIKNKFGTGYNDPKMDALKKSVKAIEDDYTRPIETGKIGKLEKHNDLNFNELIRYQYLKTLTDYHAIISLDDCESPYGQAEMNSFLSRSICGLTTKGNQFDNNTKKINTFISGTHDVIVKLLKSKTTSGSNPILGDSDGDGMNDPSSRPSFRNRGRRDRSDFERERQAEKEKDMDEVVSNYAANDYVEKTAAPLDLGLSGQGLGTVMATLPYFLNMFNNQGQNNFYPGMNYNYYGGAPGIDWSTNSIPLFEDPWYDPTSTYLFQQPYWNGYTDHLYGGSV
ncbi:hypothetical protein N9N67_08115 [Bacteriovoracaceae bacterium]|nr:hypothetical protein [Bacteriovoracaceae bacterium]